MEEPTLYDEEDEYLWDLDLSAPASTSYFSDSSDSSTEALQTNPYPNHSTIIRPRHRALSIDSQISLLTFQFLQAARARRCSDDSTLQTLSGPSLNEFFDSSPFLFSMSSSIEATLR